MKLSLQKSLTYLGGIAIVLAVLAVCVVWFWRPGSFFKYPNWGHRLGGDVVSDHPENTLEIFRLTILDRKLESNEAYLYSECDLRETADHEIVIFHDWDLGRLVPDTHENRAAIGTSEKIEKQTIHELTLEQVKKLRLSGGEQIPTLEELLECACELNLQKPLLLEIKLLRTDAGRRQMLELAEKYRDQSDLQIDFLAFRRNISRSFDDPRKWLDKIKASGFRVYQVYRSKTPQNDICENW